MLTMQKEELYKHMDELANKIHKITEMNLDDAMKLVHDAYNTGGSKAISDLENYYLGDQNFTGV